MTRQATNALVATYAFDADNRRVTKTVVNARGPATSTEFVYDGWDELETRDGDDSATGAGDERLFYHANALGSVFALTDKTGAIVEGYLYDAYGKQTIFTPGVNGVVDFGGDDIVMLGGSSQMANPFLFSARSLDPETGLYDLRNRMLNVDLGRFIQRDPLGTWEDASNLGNTYAYVGNGPSNATDPSGLFLDKRIAWLGKQFLPDAIVDQVPGGANPGCRCGEQCDPDFEDTKPADCPTGDPDDTADRGANDGADGGASDGSSGSSGSSESSDTPTPYCADNSKIINAAGQSYAVSGVTKQQVVQGKRLNEAQPAVMVREDAAVKPKTLQGGAGAEGTRGQGPKAGPSAVGGLQRPTPKPVEARSPVATVRD